MSNFWQGKRVLVTGSSGFLGQHVTRLLESSGANVFAPPHLSYNLLRLPDVQRMFLVMHQPDVVFHLAAVVGGIGANSARPADFYSLNVLMNTYVLEEARRSGAKKIVTVGTVCQYPKFTAVPFREFDLWLGEPEATNSAYGQAKRGLLTHCRALRQQYGTNAIFLIPTNLFGPGDHFNPDTSHVIPALLRKFHEAKQSNAPTVEVWGSGKATRDFLYVEDCARALLLAAEHYDSPDPVNLGTGVETSIDLLSQAIKGLTAYTGMIQYNQTKPDGQPRRVLDTSRAREAFGWHATTPLKEGLHLTYRWYLEKICHKSAS